MSTSNDALTQREDDRKFNEARNITFEVKYQEFVCDLVDDLSKIFDDETVEIESEKGRLIAIEKMKKKLIKLNAKGHKTIDL